MEKKLEQLIINISNIFGKELAPKEEEGALRKELRAFLTHSRRQHIYEENEHIQTLQDFCRSHLDFLLEELEK